MLIAYILTNMWKLKLWHYKKKSWINEVQHPGHINPENGVSTFPSSCSGLLDYTES
jgi:hypothetical protein